MKTTDLMIKQGNWLFRYRSWLPLILLGFALIGMWIERDVYSWSYFPYTILCILVALFGQFVRIVAVGYAADRTSGRNTKQQVADEINQTGIYSLMRHPLYVGNFFMWLGIALYTRIWWIVLVFLFVYWLYYERIIMAEEAFLEGKFGADYLAYADVINCIIPEFGTYESPRYHFRIKKVLRQENSGLFGLVLVFMFFEVFQNLVHSGQFKISTFWIVSGNITAWLYLALRILKKLTRILHDDVQRQKSNYEE